jgi:hypothetical protein
MYERCLEGNLARLKSLTGISLFTDFILDCFDFNFTDWFLILLLQLIDPIVDSDGAFGILLYIVSQFQTWHQAMPKYVMKSGRTYTELFCYAALFFVVTLNPFCELVHFFLFFYFFSWTKIRFSDTFVSITRQGVENKALKKFSKPNQGAPNP